MATDVRVTTSAGPAGRFEQADANLRRAMPFQHILFLSIGGIIGSGWLYAEIGAAGLAGPAGILSWLLGGLFVILIALSYAELSGMLPRSGAVVRYPQLTHGAFTGWVMGWTYWLAAISVPAIEAAAVVGYLGGRYPGAHLVHTAQGVSGVLTWPAGGLLAVGLMALFFLLNVLGVRLLSEWNRWFTWWKIIIPVATFVLLFLVFKSANFTAYGGFFPNGPGTVFQALSTSGIAFAFLGFRQALDYAGESRNPQRDVPLATILSVAITAVIYTILQVAFTGAIDWRGAGIAPGDWSALAGSSWGSTPLYSAMTAAGVGSMLVFANFLLVDAAISPSGTGWIYLGTAVRTNYGLSVNGYAPKVFQRANRFGIPWVAALVAALVGCLFFVPAPSWYLLVKFITSTTVLTYIMGGLGLPVLRRYAPGLPRPFRLRAASIWAPLGFLAALEIVYWSGFTTLTSVYAAVFIGLPIFVWSYARLRGWIGSGPGLALGVAFLAVWVYVQDRGGWVMRLSARNGAQTPGTWSFPTYAIATSVAVLLFTATAWLLSNAEGRRHIARGLWLVVMLLVLFPLSYYGEFGPLKTPVLVFPWGTLAAAVIGLVGYYWGVASGFFTDELRDIVEHADSGAVAAGPAGRAGLARA